VCLRVSNLLLRVLTTFGHSYLRLLLFYSIDDASLLYLFVEGVTRNVCHESASVVHTRPPISLEPRFVQDVLRIEFDELSNWTLALSDIWHFKAFITIFVLMGRDG